MLAGLLEQSANVLQQLSNMVVDGTLQGKQMLDSLALVSATIDYILEAVNNERK